MTVGIRRDKALPSPGKNWALLALPFMLVLVVGIVRLATGPGHGLLALIAMGPATAAALGGVLYTVLVGAMALAEELLFAFVLQPATTAEQWQTALLTIAGVTIGGALASHVRLRRERELVEVRAVADVTQRVLLRPVPDRIGAVRLGARYVSATSQARIGGDLYAAVPTATGLRLIVGDVEGKGLTAVRHAAAAMDAFRTAAAREEDKLGAVAARIEAALEDELAEEQFITGVLVEVCEDSRLIEIVNCGHPQPLLLRPGGPDFLGPADGGLPFGMGRLCAAPRVPFTVPWEAGEPVLFYTDGLTEARDKSGHFFPLAGSAAVRGFPADPAALLDRLVAEVGDYSGHDSHDDMALLLMWREDAT